MTRGFVVIAMLSAATLTGGQSTVTGRIVVDESGEPLANARVRIIAAGRSAPFIATDSEGRFTFVEPAGGYTVSAVKSGYIRIERAFRAPVDTISLRLQRAAVVSGRIVDRLGEPVVNATVFAHSPSSPGAGRSIARTTTDDRGDFRLAGLAAGPVVVSVMTMGTIAETQQRGDRLAVMMPSTSQTWFAQASRAEDATIITLAPGDDHSGVDIVVGADQIGMGGAVLAVRADQPASRSTTTGAIQGRVTSTDGRGLGGAHVRLIDRGMPAPLASRAARTDADGRYEFANVAAGTFRVAVMKSGYEPAKVDDAILPAMPTFGTGRTVQVHDGERVEDVDIELRRMGTVSGSLSDEAGDPVQGAVVQLMHVRYERGRRRLVAAGTSRTTDDRGSYRIFDVPEGQYLVIAAIGGVAAVDLPGYAQTYFPGTPDPRAAQFVSVTPSQDVAGIDISLEQTRTARVAGTILGSDGQPTMGGTLQLRPNAGAGEIAALPVGASIKEDGTFEFPNVPPGEYLIYADKGRQQVSTEGDFQTLPVSVNGTDIVGLTLQAPPGSTIAGHITFDTLDPDHPPPLSKIEIRPMPVDADLAPGNVADAEIHADGTFRLDRITGARRLVATRVPTGWSVREVRVNGIDVTDRPIAFGRPDQSLTDVEFVLTDRIAELVGSVVDGDGHPAPGAVVVAIPVDRDRRYYESRYLRSVASAADGTFGIAGIPGGAYYVAAVGSVPADGDDAWQDPAYLEPLAGLATAVTLREGEKHTMILRLTGDRR